jgi:hypothetical protein
MYFMLLGCRVCHLDIGVEVSATLRPLPWVEGGGDLRETHT